MSKVVLHIGTHKTATTTIQDMFHKNAGLLEQHGVVYPRIGRVTGHHGLVYDWGRLPPVFQLEVSSLDALTWIAREHAHKKDVTVFLSSEEFSRVDPDVAVDFAAVRERLSAFDEIEVVCVLRTQWRFLQSVYLELSRNQNPVRPPKIVANAIEKGMSLGLAMDYNIILDRLEQFFAPEEITLLDFDTLCASQDGIVGAMLRHLDVPLGLADLEAVNNGKSNVSPQPLATWLSNIMTEPVRPPQWLVNHATKAFEEICPKPFRPCLFSGAEFNTLATHFRPLNDRLRERRKALQPDFAITQPVSKEITLFRHQVPITVSNRVIRLLVMDRIRAEKNEKKQN
ncbi:hypothetical protein OS189_17055 [Sulfitobacter sp. F26169L]|uniref:hypothetical protein n=1 Tax=Sulfitobacter sp. F26169L TaxID=2996015 RepID=UPI002260FD2C|nr:hypothetical protein [Sulfitobacter sp. F26169L]MCX7568054.1 hypothetical protein [Sulfitobacter sp. F26169L]